MRRRLVLSLAAVILTGPVMACSDPGVTTCAEYGALDYKGRDSLLDDLLGAHRLDQSHLGNQVGVSQSVDAFCGTWTSAVTSDRPATQNLNRPIDEAVDWDSDTW